MRPLSVGELPRLPSGVMAHFALPVPEEAYVKWASLRWGPAMRSRTLAIDEFGAVTRKRRPTA
jgi:hypothetical protein